MLDGIPCPKEPKRLPVVLSRDEVTQFLAAAPRFKSRRVMLTLGYAAGLRVSEIVALEVGDIDSRQWYAHSPGEGTEGPLCDALAQTAGVAANILEASTAETCAASLLHTLDSIRSSDPTPFMVRLAPPCT